MASSLFEPLPVIDTSHISEDHDRDWHKARLRARASRNALVPLIAVLVSRLYKPKSECACRDALLGTLKMSLAPVGVKVDSEVRHADAKRADMGVSFGGFEVPIEVKASWSGDLWTAMHNQLIPKYTRSPGAGGHGIFLVFWFGQKGAKSAPTGNPPRSAEDLRERLKGQLSDREAQHISVCVIDVAPPA